MSSLRCQNIVFRYPTGWQLGPYSATFAPGVVALVGPNGAGKSTLMRILAGVESPASGELSLGGISLNSRRTLDDYRMSLGYLPQAVSWPRGWRVRDILEYSALAHGCSRRDLSELLAEAMAQTGTEDFAWTPIGRLSGGQRQRAFVASAVVHQPDVLVLDEPSAGLDPRERVRFRKLLATVAEGRVAVLSTHLLDDVALSADTVHVVADGKNLWSGDVPSLEAEAGEDHPSHMSAAEAGYWRLTGSDEADT